MGFAHGLILSQDGNVSQIIKSTARKMVVIVKFEGKTIIAIARDCHKRVQN